MHIVFCTICRQSSCCSSKSACRSQTEPVWENMGCPRGQSQGHKNPEKRLYSPRRAPTNLTRSPITISSCVHPLNNRYLMQALHARMQKQRIEKVKNQTFLVFFNKLFLVPKPNNKWRPNLDLSSLNKFLNGDTRKCKDFVTNR